MIKPTRRAFTLLEVLVTAGILLCLATLILPALRSATKRSEETKAINHLRRLGTALASFASENNGGLPMRTENGDLWPAALISYLEYNPEIYAEPGSTINYRTLNVDPLSNLANHTSYTLNSLRDLGDRAKTMFNIPQPASTIMMAPHENTLGFFMDIDRNDFLRIVKYREYRNGAHYLFGDGSIRFVLASDYSPRLWMADKSFELRE